MITANDVAGVIPRDVPQDAPDSGVDTAGAGRVTAAYSAIKEAIRSNVFPPGYQAAEIEIARQLGMSRTPVHEAMARLQEDGLVRILPKKGIIICALSPADIEEIYEVIIALEGAAAARLAQLQMKERTPVVQILQSATASMVGALAENDLEAWAAADERFHEELVARSGNRRLMRMAGTVADQLHRARMFTLNLRPLPIHSSDEHWEIIQAIDKGDAEAASRAARSHRQHAHDALVPLIAKLNLRNL
ncbi:MULTISPECIES: GntR family transcriptional regulator [Agrobacterium tumefaciens complex]|uniref:GntR family transcriptional regulator n=1 Tax=Agrobacterium tumefaciens complex TaxID=1183400 RepID=UPI0011F101C4|nr:GntR family transcriptional regulator [Agrobacterium tumefaciens]KAA1233948.1 GntR family transcriptional regulator [Agrobacterium tumefaciens]MCW8061224.1 GntR family transcriptional regulator [Agrobacterium tumefaciens]MCW8146041.1 GntR family transcriptional regulator [Agrobacterium tumefaciens]MQB40272.1 GntR family transcriptional regulator [Agrobacterium tumefaciens]NSX87445.1 GntR family transcriptional regulator [Agrobacterium tumefaciens]